MVVVVEWELEMSKYLRSMLTGQSPAVKVPWDGVLPTSRRCGLETINPFCTLACEVHLPLVIFGRGELFGCMGACMIGSVGGDLHVRGLSKVGVVRW